MCHKIALKKSESLHTKKRVYCTKNKVVENCDSLVTVKLTNKYTSLKAEGHISWLQLMIKEQSNNCNSA